MKYHCHCVAGCVAKLTLTPCNTVATLQQQEPAVLSCKTDMSYSPLIWAFGDVRKIIFNGYDVKERYPVLRNSEKGEFNLSLRPLDASYAGLYICMEPGTHQRASAQLTILGELLLSLSSYYLYRLKCSE